MPNEALMDHLVARFLYQGAAAQGFQHDLSIFDRHLILILLTHGTVWLPLDRQVAWAPARLTRTVTPSALLRYPWQKRWPAAAPIIVANEKLAVDFHGHVHSCS